MIEYVRQYLRHHQPRRRMPVTEGGKGGPYPYNGPAVVTLVVSLHDLAVIHGALVGDNRAGSQALKAQVRDKLAALRK